MTFDAHKLLRSEPFLDYQYELWQLLLSALDVRKNSIQVHIYVPGCKVPRWIFLKNLSGIYEVVRIISFAPIFWTFRNFRPQFRENCGATVVFRFLFAEVRSLPCKLMCQLVKYVLSRSLGQRKTTSAKNMPLYLIPHVCKVKVVLCQNQKKNEKRQWRHSFFAFHFS